MGIPLSSFGMILSLVLDLTGEPAKGLCFLLRWVPWKKYKKNGTHLKQHNPQEVYQYYTINNIFSLNT
jgi:hypothetical protein